MFRPKLAVWLLIALVAAWLASCSSNVDGYHLATEESGVSAAAASGTSGAAGATGGTSTNGGASTNGGRMGIAPGGGGAGGGTGGRDLDSGPDGDSSLGGAGGVLVGGAGGDNTGGVAAGGSQNGGAGGSQNGGAQNGGAGSSNTGGAPTGGAPTGGRQNSGGATGGAPTGGAPTGGRGNTGGAPTGGAPTGGAPTGGAPTGGAPTGGAPTGGAPTGGAPTGGVTNTGGAAGYPGDPTQQALTGATPSNITAAAWVPSAHKFYLLKPSSREYFVLSTDGTVTGPIGLQGSGAVATNVFGASATDVFFVSGSPVSVFRQSITTGTATQVQLPGSPALGILTGAYATGWFLVGNASGAFQALADGSSTLTTNANMSQVHVVTTDVSSFAFRTIGTGNKVVVHRIAPGSFGLNTAPCDSLAVGAPTLDVALGVYGSSVAWVFKRPFSAPLQLNVAVVTSGSCGAPLQTDVGDASSTVQTLGLISDTDALVTPSVPIPMVTIEIKRAGSTTFSRATMTANMGSASAYPVAFVVGVEPTPHSAVLVTKFTPILISF